MRLRVVCGLRVTMASFSPTSALSKVDFPALGRPMMETNPDRNAMSALDLLGGRTRLQTNTHSIHTAVGGFQHFEAQPVLLEDFSRLGYVSREFAHQSRNCGRLFFIGPHAEQFLQQVHVGVSVQNIRGLALFHEVSLLVLVADLANDLLHQVFDRYQAPDAAVLVYYDGHANVVAL